MKYVIEQTTQYKKDYKLAVNRGRDINKLKEVVEMLANGEPLPEKCKDHELVNSRNYQDRRECHIEPDWLLIYKISENTLVLALSYTGSCKTPIQSPAQIAGGRKVQ